MNSEDGALVHQREGEVLPADWAACSFFCAAAVLWFQKRHQVFTDCVFSLVKALLLTRKRVGCEELMCTFVSFCSVQKG